MHTEFAALQALGFLGLWSCDFRRGFVQTEFSGRPMELCLDRDGLGFKTGTSHMRIHPDDAAWLATERVKTVGPSGWSVVEYRVIDDAENTRWVMCRARYELDEVGDLVIGRGMMFDVTGTVTDSSGAHRAPAPIEDPLTQLIDSVLAAYQAARQMNDESAMWHLRMVLELGGRRLAWRVAEHNAGLHDRPALAEQTHA